MYCFSHYLFFAVWGIIVLVHSPFVSAGWPSNMNKEDRATLGGVLSGKLQLPAELALFVKYKNKKGKRFAKRWSKDGIFLKHYPNQQVVSVHVKNSTALKKMTKCRYIEYVEPVHKLRALRILQSNHAIITNGDPEYNGGYGIKMVQADKLWDIAPADVITICIIDSGYGLGHPDLPDLDNNVTGSTTSIGDWFFDGYGHGTHVAGTIGATGKEKGVVGIMKDASRFNFHIGKALNSEGIGTEENLVEAFDSCIDSGAKVISMSLGTDKYSETIQAICKKAYDDGILIISAAGNEGGDAYNYPASYPHVMSVAAVGKDKKVASFSQYNDQVEIAGPGVDILSTVTTKNGKAFGYDSWSGTSMATPYVAGVAALVWSHFPNCTNNQIRNILIRTAKEVGGIGCNEELGFGIVQAKGAYDLLKKERCNAGDVSPIPLSDGAKGGCSQDPLYAPQPTSAPTAFTCKDKVFQLELTTDAYGDETSWELRNSTGQIIGSGSGYRSSTFYTETMCLPLDEYTFTIHDSESDGICCRFENGKYSVSFDKEVVKSGGKFRAVDTFKFGKNSSKPQTSRPLPSPMDKEPSSSPTILPPVLPKSPPFCQDDSAWVHTTFSGKAKKCNYLTANPSTRCFKRGVNGLGRTSSGYESCPVTAIPVQMNL